MHYPWLVAITIPVVIALAIAWVEYRYNFYIGVALLRDSLFCGLYVYYWMYQPDADTRRMIGIPVLIFMESWLLTASFWFIYQRVKKYLKLRRQKLNVGE